MDATHTEQWNAQRRRDDRFLSTAEWRKMLATFGYGSVSEHDAAPFWIGTYEGWDRIRGKHWD